MRSDRLSHPILSIVSNPTYQLLISGKEYGPYTVSDLKSALAENSIMPDCLSRPTTGGEWVQVSHVVGAVGGPVGTAVRGSVSTLRNHTAYRPLRSLITVVALVAVIFFAVALSYAIYKTMHNEPGWDWLLALELGTTIALILIGWGLAHVLIDIADANLTRS